MKKRKWSPIVWISRDGNMWSQGTATVFKREPVWLRGEQHWCPRSIRELYSCIELECDVIEIFFGVKPPPYPELAEVNLATGEVVNVWLPLDEEYMSSDQR